MLFVQHSYSFAETLGLWEIKKRRMVSKKFCKKFQEQSLFLFCYHYPYHTFRQLSQQFLVSRWHETGFGSPQGILAAFCAAPGMKVTKEQPSFKCNLKSITDMRMRKRQRFRCISCSRV